MGGWAFAVTNHALNLDTLIRIVTSDLEAAEASTGAVATFLGVVRNQNQGHRVRRLEYEAYEPLALKTFERIADEARSKWPQARLAVHHRLGTLEIGDASVAIAAASPHRADAFAACRYAIERVKQVAPIWKHEFFEDGDVWIKGTIADPDDEVARQDAYRRACM